MRSSIEKEDEKREGKMEERGGVGQMNTISNLLPPLLDRRQHFTIFEAAIILDQR